MFILPMGDAQFVSLAHFAPIFTINKICFHALLNFTQYSKISFQQLITESLDKHHSFLDTIKLRWWQMYNIFISFC